MFNINLKKTIGTAKSNFKLPVVKSGKLAYITLSDLFTSPEISSLVGAPASAAIETVTQLTSISTGVEINGEAGVITTVGHSYNATPVQFLVTNSSVTANSMINATIETPFDGGLILTMESVSAGSFILKIANNSGTGSIGTVSKIHFRVIN